MRVLLERAGIEANSQGGEGEASVGGAAVNQRGASARRERSRS